ncbi:hypothetical protein KIN20_032936 [Parelaphostrongylus tenuis]|uniref:Uncharacterized protein n=1 Tax=Parelaphostrongylus tenuis TaxID=148309 RepID=A0AAD5R7B2_PARTN|nr:hypothetical protein KIN20_032936 [Parelaphostrongylus tenuis]
MANFLTFSRVVPWQTARCTIAGSRLIAIGTEAVFSRPAVGRSVAVARLEVPNKE